MWVLKLVGFFFGYGWLWGRRKPAAKSSPIKPSQENQARVPPPVPKKASAGLQSGQGAAKVTKLFRQANHAWLTRLDGKGEVFLSLHVAKSCGVEDVAEGQVYNITWDKSAKKPGRLDVRKLALQK